MAEFDSIEETYQIPEDIGKLMLEKTKGLIYEDSDIMILPKIAGELSKVSITPISIEVSTDNISGDIDKTMASDLPLELGEPLLQNVINLLKANSTIGENDISWKDVTYVSFTDTELIVECDGVEEELEDDSEEEDEF